MKTFAHYVAVVKDSFGTSEQKGTLIKDGCWSESECKDYINKNMFSGKCVRIDIHLLEHRS